MANVDVRGTVSLGSQQQFFARNCSAKRWESGRAAGPQLVCAKQLGLYSNRAVGCEQFPMFTVVRQRVPGAWSFVFVGCPGAPHSEPVEAWRDEHFRRVQCIT